MPRDERGRNRFNAVEVASAQYETDLKVRVNFAKIRLFADCQIRVQLAFVDAGDIVGHSAEGVVLI